MPREPGRSLLSLRDPSPADWDAMLRTADAMGGPLGREPHLAGKRLGMLFFNASLRTRTSFEVGCFDMGAHAVYLQVGGGLWNLERRTGVVMDGGAAEHIREGIPVLGEMVDGLGVRAFAGLTDAADDATDPVLRAVADASTVPVLNLESAMDHPHQGITDALTVRRRFPSRKVRVALTWAPHIKPLPLAVIQAALLAFAREGHEVVLAHPGGFDVDAAHLDAARQFSAAAGGSLEVTHDQGAALGGADVVYAKSWGPPIHYGDPDAATQALTAHRDWLIDEAAMAHTNEGVFMHCLPVRRGVVVSEGVLESERSIVVEQAGARLDVQKATLCRAFGVDPLGLGAGSGSAEEDA